MSSPGMISRCGKDTNNFYLAFRTHGNFPHVASKVAGMITDKPVELEDNTETPEFISKIKSDSRP